VQQRTTNGAVAARHPARLGRSREFLEHIKVDLFPDEVYVFTPGKIMAMPRGATAWILPTRCTPTSATAARGENQLRARAAQNRAQERRPVEIITAAHEHPNRRGCPT